MSAKSLELKVITQGGIYMNIKPLFDRVLIKAFEAKEEKTASGLLLSPNTATGEPLMGEVVACGDGKFASNGELIPMSVSVGDKVMMNKNSGQTVKIEGEEYKLLFESEIMAIVK